MKYNLVYKILSEIQKSTHSGIKNSKLIYPIFSILILKNLKLKLSILEILYKEGYINGYKLTYSYKKKNINNIYVKDLTINLLSNLNLFKLFYKNIISFNCNFLKRKVFNKIEKIESYFYKNKKYFLYKKYNKNNIIKIKNNNNLNYSQLYWNWNVVPITQVQLIINIYYKYTNKLLLINYFLQISKPSRRIFITVKEFDQFLFFYTKKIILKKKKSLGILLLSTNKGILSNSIAKKKNVGGELLSVIF